MHDYGFILSGQVTKLWLNTSNISLENQKPIDLLKDSKGKYLVISELIRIDFRIFV
ncbi:antitoxin Xre/MbcA/ParS toxin-binding domain-containing protein [Lunatibacter salilacus]|uniref:antitoxin Xre/MbcA/ParS toxin-binding domain-containing protein n=1 Tax=Lunatibacter salilacus TaxID=2483804 RepID=UPI00131D2939|nr:MbcA/ParS/Xre antitoxin family protein [Lunatibacter salilacus]